MEKLELIEAIAKLNQSIELLINANKRKETAIAIKKLIELIERL